MASRAELLAAEIINDPTTQGYTNDGNDAANLALINAQDIPVNRDSMTGAEVFEFTDSTEFQALTAEAKSQWLQLCGIDSLDPFGPAQQIAVQIFGGSSATILALGAARSPLKSRAEIIMGSQATTSDFISARDEGRIV